MKNTNALLMSSNTVKIISCTFFALLAFAGNSVLCRLALGEGKIDAASFTIIRLVSGVAVLFAIVFISGANRGAISRGSWLASFMLFLYAITFSFAYVSLDTGTGALILFGAVQITMIMASQFFGKRLYPFEWIGMALAFFGFVYLVKPILTAPSLKGLILMSAAGVAWGIYTLKGRGSKSPASDTAFNFLRTLPFVLGLIIFVFPGGDMSREGILLAVGSGAIASGIGYVIWYIALRGLSTTQAAVVQLFVPVIAAAGGVVFSGERISMHLIFSSLMVLGGIMIVILGKYYYVKKPLF